MFWIVVWLLLSFFVLGAFAWTTRILFRQKKEWAAFAAKHKFKYEKGSLLNSPSIEGTAKGYRIAVFSSPRLTPDARGVRFRTAVELSAIISMPTVGAVGIGDIVTNLEPLDLRQTLALSSPHWDERFFLKSHDALFLQGYLTEERFKALSDFLKIHCDTAIWLFDRQNMLLRFETVDPYADAKRLGGLVGKMVETANILFPKEKPMSDQSPQGQVPQDSSPQNSAPQGQTS